MSEDWAIRSNEDAILALVRSGTAMTQLALMSALGLPNRTVSDALETLRLRKVLRFDTQTQRWMTREA